MHQLQLIVLFFNTFSLSNIKILSVINGFRRCSVLIYHSNTLFLCTSCLPPLTSLTSISPMAVLFLLSLTPSIHTLFPLPTPNPNLSLPVSTPLICSRLTSTTTSTCSPPPCPKAYDSHSSTTHSPSSPPPPPSSLLQYEMLTLWLVSPGTGTACQAEWAQSIG